VLQTPNPGRSPENSTTNALRRGYPGAYRLRPQRFQTPLYNESHEFTRSFLRRFPTVHTAGPSFGTVRSSLAYGGRRGDGSQGKPRGRTTPRRADPGRT